MDEIKLLRNNDEKNLADLDWVKEFYEFLQGNVPDGMALGHGLNIKLSRKKAFTIIWYLQEHFPILPDTIEQCSICGELFDIGSSGYHSDKRAKFFCGVCDDGKD